MKKTLEPALLFLLAFSVSPAGAEITVEVENVSPVKGQVVLGLYQAGEFPETGLACNATLIG